MSATAKKHGTAEAARKAAVHRFHLEYRRPWMIFYPTAVAFLLLNYLAFCTTADEAGTSRVLPDYIASYAASRAYMREAAASGTAPSESAALNALLWFEENVMGFLFQLGVRLFRSLFGIQAVCVGAWLVHFFELGMSSRICFSCNATAGTTALYMLCTTLAGFAQLVPQTAARDAWLAKVRETANDASTPVSKKEK
jgi:hypothetical protein